MSRDTVSETIVLLELLSDVVPYHCIVSLYIVYIRLVQNCCLLYSAIYITVWAPAPFVYTTFVPRIVGHVSTRFQEYIFFIFIFFWIDWSSTVCICNHVFINFERVINIGIDTFMIFLTFVKYQQYHVISFQHWLQLVLSANAIDNLSYILIYAISYCWLSFLYTPEEPFWWFHPTRNPFPLVNFSMFR
jgi:hypothetical protein